MLVMGAVFWYFWPFKHENTAKGIIHHQSLPWHDNFNYNNWKSLYGDHINIEPKIDFYTEPVIKLDSENDNMNSYTKPDTNLDDNNYQHGRRRKNINSHTKPGYDFGANYPYQPLNYYAQQNIRGESPLFYQGLGSNGYPYNMNNPLFAQGLGVEGSSYCTRPNMGGGNSLFSNHTKDNSRTYNIEHSSFDNNYESSTEGGTRKNMLHPAIAKKNLLKAQKEQDDFFKNLIQSLEKNTSSILNSLEDLNEHLDFLCDIIKSRNFNKIVSDLSSVSEKVKQVEKSFDNICESVSTGLSKSKTFLAQPQLLEKLNNYKCKIQKEGHNAMDNIYQVFNAMMNDKMDSQSDEKALERNLAECVKAFGNLSKELQNLNIVNNMLLERSSKYYKELR